MGHYYKFRSGDKVIITSGRYKEVSGGGSVVFQRTVDYPDEFAPGYEGPQVASPPRLLWDEKELAGG